MPPRCVVCELPFEVGLNKCGRCSHPCCPACGIDLAGAKGRDCPSCGALAFPPEPLLPIMSHLDPHLVLLLVLTAPLLGVFRRGFPGHELNRYLLGLTVAGYAGLILLWAWERRNLYQDRELSRRWVGWFVVVNGVLVGAALGAVAALT